MDPLTQGALGAAVVVAAAPPERIRAAAVLGGLAAMAPDLDVLVRSSTDPLLLLETHRQFTHALAFIPLGALLCAIAAYPFVQRRESFRFTYLCCFGGYATHGLLDGCTSYGTRLLWPFSDARIAWNVVSVVDPLVTLPLLAGAGLAVARCRPRAARLGLAAVAVYLALGLVQRERASATAAALAAERGHAATRTVAKPSFGNLLVWKTLYEAHGRYHVDAVRLGYAARVFPGESVAALDTARDLPWLVPGSRQADDLDRFTRFSSGFVAPDPRRSDRIIDVRYSMVPNRIDPLWGIRLDPEAGPERHATFFTERGLTPDARSEIFRMLAGEDRGRGG